MGAVPEIVEFLLAYPPFNALARAEVERAAASADVEFHLGGTVIFSQGAHSSEFLRVIRAGVVEIVHDGRVLDVIGVGEMFGHASMLSGLPTGFAARAAEDTLTYRIPADAAYRLLGQPETLRYVDALAAAGPLWHPPGAAHRGRPGPFEPAGQRPDPVARGYLPTRHSDPGGGPGDERPGGDRRRGRARSVAWHPDRWRPSVPGLGRRQITRGSRSPRR